MRITKNKYGSKKKTKYFVRIGGKYVGYASFNGEAEFTILLEQQNIRRQLFTWNMALLIAWVSGGVVENPLTLEIFQPSVAADKLERWWAKA